MIYSLESKQISNRYAKALLSLSIEADSIDKVSKDLSSLFDTIKSSKELSKFILTTILDVKSIIDIIYTICDKLGICDLVKQTIRVLVENGRISLLKFVILSFENILLEYRGTTEVFVVSASDLSNNKKLLVRGAIEEVIKGNFVIRYTIDSSIIGGLVVRIGSLMIDSSLQTKLEKLKLEMKVA